MKEEEISKEELQEKIDEGLMPSLGGIKIKIGDKEITVIEKPIFYVKQLNRKLKPVYSLLSGSKGEVKIEDLVNAEKIEEIYDNLLDITLTIVNWYDPEITLEFLEKNCSERQLIDIIHAQVKVNGLVDFFVQILKGLMSVTQNQNFKMNT
jgi:hypothetical protein